MKLSTATSIVERIVRRNLDNFRNGVRAEPLIPFLRGNPGIGKSECVRQTADKLGILEHTEVLAQSDPVELGGIYFPTDGNMLRLRPEWMPSDGEGILFFDELPQSLLAVQNVAAQALQEHRIGKHHIGRGWSIVVAGNPQSARAGTTQIPSHLKDRLVFLDIEADVQEFVDHGNRKGYSPYVLGYVRNRPDWLSKFDPANDSCPSPRSWAKVSEIVQMGFKPSEEIAMITGTIGEGAAGDFAGYIRLMREMPDVEVILSAPDTAPIPDQMQVRHGMSAVLSRAMTNDNAEACIVYMDRWKNDELTAAAVSDAIRRDPAIMQSQAALAWVRRVGLDLMRG